MTERNYIDDIVDALFKGENHRKFVLQEVQKRIVEEMAKLIKLIISKKSTIDKNWWKNKLILMEQHKEDIISFGGLNNKTISNMMGGSATIKICREVCSENYDFIKKMIDELPKNFPKLTINFKIGNGNVKFNETESFLFLFTIMSMSKRMTGGIWSEVGKQASNRFIKIAFKKLDISEIKAKGFYYELTKIGKKGEIDTRIYYDYKPILEIEIKMLGIGNPEIAREVIALESDVFIVDNISPKMREIAEGKGITVIRFKDVLTDLPKILKEKILH
jgi:hypothetical protein